MAPQDGSRPRVRVQLRLVDGNTSCNYGLRGEDWGGHSYALPICPLPGCRHQHGRRCYRRPGRYSSWPKPKAWATSSAVSRCSRSSSCRLSVPSAGIVMTMTIWASVIPSQPLPPTFAFIVATDWFLDRFQTAVNVMGDTVITRIVAEHVGETASHERQSLASAVDRLAQHNSELREVIHSTNRV